MVYSIKNDVKYEYIINKSKFITLLKRVYYEKEVNEYIEKIKKEYKGATHYCFGYILDNIKGFDDDKEPSGTAGLPILEVLDKNNLNYVLCVTIRYFGGIKLGSGGLVRAYSKGVRDALKLSQIIKLVKGKTIQISFAYNYIKKIDNILKSYSIINKEFDELITYTVNIEERDLEKIINQLEIIDNINIKQLNDVFIEN